MRIIETELQAKLARKQTHCYLCGDPLLDGRVVNRDHIPPKSIFLKEDREFPLILPAHADCNQSCSISDEQTKQLLAAIHAPFGSLPIKTRIFGAYGSGDEPTAVLLEGFNLHTIVYRIIQGCHLALYGQVLPRHLMGNVLTPLPLFNRETGEPAESNFLPQHEEFCRHLNLQRRIGNIDRIRAYNGKFRFESVWATSDDGTTNFVICAVDIYGWHQLGQEVLGRPQGCIASYLTPENLIPRNVARITSLEIPFISSEPLNPWEGAD